MAMIASELNGEKTAPSALAVRDQGPDPLHQAVLPPCSGSQPAGRYEIHELLRRYAAEKLEQTLVASAVAHERQCLIDY